MACRLTPAWSPINCANCNVYPSPIPSLSSLFWLKQLHIDRNDGICTGFALLIYGYSFIRLASRAFIYCSRIFNNDWARSCCLDNVHQIFIDLVKVDFIRLITSLYYSRVCRQFKWAKIILECLQKSEICS